MLQEYSSYIQVTNMQDTNKVLKIGSMKVRGLANKQKRPDVFDWLKGKQMDIYYLQDTHSDPVTEEQFVDDWGGKCILNSISTFSRGVAILFSSTVKIEIKYVYRQNDGNLTIAKLSISGNFEFLLVSLYGPNRDDPLFYENLKQQLFKSGNIINYHLWGLELGSKLPT